MVINKDNNTLRNIINKAQDKELISNDEIGFITILVERFRSDIDRKLQQLNILSGEIAQLRTNEKIIIDVVENIVAASERDKARKETMANIKKAKDKV